MACTTNNCMASQASKCLIPADSDFKPQIQNLIAMASLSGIMSMHSLARMLMEMI